MNCPYCGEKTHDEQRGEEGCGACRVMWVKDAGGDTMMLTYRTLDDKWLKVPAGCLLVKETG